MKLTNDLKKKAADQLEKARAAVNPETATRKTVQALKSLTRTMGKITKAVEKFEKEQTAKKSKTKPKAKKKAPVRTKTTAKKTPVKKKTTKSTATDKVLKTIGRSKKGIDVPTLIKKTGFDEKKVRNIVSRAFKQGKIKRMGRGIYVGA
jgi:hypothetical protein